jgi:hypothetical protein
MLVALQMGFAAAARADGGDFQLDFASATPGTYDQSTGTGGLWSDTVEQLEAGDFTCGDVVQHLTEVTVDSGASGTQAIEITYSFDTETTSGGQVGYGDVTYASINTGDPANQLSGNETVTLTSEQTVGDQIIATVEVTGLEADEVAIVSVGAQLVCNEDPANVTGNVDAAIESAQTSEGDTINVGQQTTPLMHLNQLAPPPPVPGISVTKECPASVNAGGVIVYTITITNTGEEDLTDIVVTDTILGDISDQFPDTLAVGESAQAIVPFLTDPSDTSVTNEVTASATGVDSGTTSDTSTDTCTTELVPPPPPTILPPTGFSGASGLSATWLFAVAGLVLLTGVGLRYAARRRS